MTRLFTGDFDRFRYGEEFADRMMKFWDAVLDLEALHPKIFSDRHLEDWVRFNIEADPPEVIFLDDNWPCDELQREVVSLFEKVVLGHL